MHETMHPGINVMKMTNHWQVCQPQIPKNRDTFYRTPPPPPQKKKKNTTGISSNENGKNNICPPVATNNIGGLSKPYSEFSLCALRKFYSRGVRWYSPGKFCDFSFNLGVSKAILSSFLLICLSLKIGTGSKNWDCPGKIGTLGRPA